MPRIVLKDKYGGRFYLHPGTASWGTGNYNTKETAEVVPQAIANSNRCPNSLTVALGMITVIMDLSVNGRTGSCNQCGQCCSHLASTCTYGASCGRTKIIGLYHACPHLVKLGPGIGKKNGTSCSIYQSLMYEGYKSCVVFPTHKSEIGTRMTFCGFSFP